MFETKWEFNKVDAEAETAILEADVGWFQIIRSQVKAKAEAANFIKVTLNFASLSADQRSLPPMTKASIFYEYNDGEKMHRILIYASQIELRLLRS